MKRWGLTPYIIAFLSMLVVVSGFNFWQKTKGNDVAQSIIKSLGWAKDDQNSLVPTLSPTPTQTPIALTDQEKIGQVIAFPIVLDESAISDEFWQTLEVVKPGFVVIFGDKLTMAQVQSFTEELNKKTNHWVSKPLVAVDHEGGSVQRLAGTGFTLLPSWQKLCRLSDQERFDLLQQSATELQTAGIDLVFAPVVDLYNLQSTMGDRACDSNPQRVAVDALDWINIFSKKQIYSVIKHYPGLSHNTVDTHDQFETIDLTLDDVEPFRIILTQKPQVGVMTAHVGIKDLYDEPCTLSKACIASLREHYPQTLIFSDALDMKAISGNQNPTDQPDLSVTSYKALEAGVDVLLFGRGVKTKQLQTVYQTLENKLVTDENFLPSIDESVKRISFYYHDKLGL